MSQKNYRRYLILGSFLWALALEPGLAGTVVVLNNGTAKKYDAKTGAYKGAIGAGDVVSASSDGEIIAVVTRDGYVKRYDSKGAYKGQLGGGEAASVQVSSGAVIITYKDGQIKKYDAKTGAYKGSF